MNALLGCLMLVAALIVPASGDNAAQVDYCASPYLWLYKASGGAIGTQWYGPVARAFNHFADTGDDYALHCVVRWMGLERVWPEYRAYCGRYIASPGFAYMEEPIGVVKSSKR